MPLMVAMDDLEPDQKLTNPRSKPGSAHTDFIKSSSNEPDTPTAYLVEHAPGRLSSAHFHANDQFQIVVHGKGSIGRHAMWPYTVHFARAYTPYGPLQADHETGWAFMTLRRRYDPGAQHLPAARAKLDQIHDRNPWQVSQHVHFLTAAADSALREIPGIRDENGLAAYAISLPPHARTLAPHAAASAGQFILVLQGGLIHQKREKRALAVAFVTPEENAFAIEAGQEGVKALVLNFPRPAH